MNKKKLIIIINIIKMDLHLLNLNLKDRVMNKYSEKLRRQLLDKFGKNSYTLEILEKNILFYKNKYKTTQYDITEELKSYIKRVFNININHINEYVKIRQRIFVDNLINMLLNKLEIYELEELYEYVKDKRIYI